MSMESYGYVLCPFCNGEHHKDDDEAWRRCAPLPRKDEQEETK